MGFVEQVKTFIVFGERGTYAKDVTGRGHCFAERGTYG